MSKKVIYKENDIEKEVDFDDLEDIENIDILDDDEDFEEGSIRGKVVAITPFVCVIVYLLLGFLEGLWHPGWLVFLLIPIVPLVLKLFSGRRGSLIAFLELLVVVAYLLLGFLGGWWHPGWIIFLLMPIIGILFGKKDD